MVSDEIRERTTLPSKIAISSFIRRSPCLCVLLYAKRFYICIHGFSARRRFAVLLSVLLAVHTWVLCFYSHEQDARTKTDD
jgi:hypothetical protein